MTLESRINSAIKTGQETKLELGRMKRRVEAIEKDTTLQGNLTKYQFRGLLTQTQKLIFDNFELLKDDLGLTTLQVAQLRTWTKDFELASSVDLNDPLLAIGLNMVLAWDLQYNGAPVFTQADVDRILAGETA
jgi:hypothetical protein